MKIGIMGAGAVGCWIGGCLAAHGEDVVLVARPRVKEELEASGLRVVDIGGKERASLRMGGDARCAVDPAALADRDAVLVCVKSAQTEEVGAALAPVLGTRAVVASLQNGVRNADLLRERLPGRAVLGGIVGFNVVAEGGGVFRRATTGPLVLEASTRAAELFAAMRAACLPLTISDEIRGLSWSKLVMNLNNAVGALTDAPTRELVFDPGYRRVVGAVVREALHVMACAGVRPVRLGAIPVRAFPYVLRLPTAILRVVARAQLRMDPEARSSMWQDLAKGRPTEVDWLNGEIVRLARSCGARAPVNERIVALVHEAEARGAGSPRMSAAALLAAITA